MEVKKITDTECKEFFWKGIPPKTRKKIWAHLEIDDQKLQCSEYPNIEKVMAAGKFLFSRAAEGVDEEMIAGWKKSSKKKKGKKSKREDSSDEDSDSDMESESSSEEDSELETSSSLESEEGTEPESLSDEERRKKKKRKEKKLKKGKKSEVVMNYKLMIPFPKSVSFCSYYLGNSYNYVFLSSCSCTPKL